MYTRQKDNYGGLI